MSKVVEALHPSEFIQDELDARGWSLDRLAVEMGGDTGLNRLAMDMYFLVGPNNANCRLGADTAQQLSVAFGVSAQFFLNLEQVWLTTPKPARAAGQEDGA